MQRELERLIVNNAALSNIRAHVAHFNPIKVMGMENMEIRHSNILGWLLNPRENHGLGDDFIKAFLCQAMLGQEKKLNSLEINNRNLADANVFIEWNHIDIFIEVPDKDEPWCFVIENKVHSKQHSNQLTKYREKVKERYPNHKAGYIYLTLNDEEPEDENYTRIQYEQVVEILSMLLDQVKDTVSTRIYNFINYYQEVISELCDMNEENEKMKALASQIYQDNKKALDFIYEHGMSNEFDYALTQFLGDKNSKLKARDVFVMNGLEYEFGARNHRAFDFLPLSWVKQLDSISLSNDHDFERPWAGTEKWRNSGLPIVAWLDFIESNSKNGTSFYIRLVIEVGPITDSELRMRLVRDLASQFGDLKELKFQKSAIQAGAKYSKCLSIKEKLNDQQDSSEIVLKVEKLLSKFEKNYLSAIERGLMKFKDSLEGDVKPNIS